MASLGEMLAQAGKVGLSVVDYIDTRNANRQQANLEAELARQRAETDRLRAGAEAASQALALQTNLDTQANMQKWLTWAIVGLVVVGGGLVLGRMFSRRAA